MLHFLLSSPVVKKFFAKLESSSSKKNSYNFPLRIRILESRILMKVSSKTECHTISRRKAQEKTDLRAQ